MRNNMQDFRARIGNQAKHNPLSSPEDQDRRDLLGDHLAELSYGKDGDNINNTHHADYTPDLESVKGLLAAYRVQSSPTYSPNMVKGLWKREFRLRFIKVEHHRPEQFVKSQWQGKPQVDIIYLTYRWLLAGIFVATMICSICDAGRNNDFGVRYIKWAIYLTNWGYTVCTLQALMAAALLTQQRIAEIKQDSVPNSKSMPISYKVYWVLHTIGVVMAVGITTAYWVSIYNPAVHTLDALNLMVHAFNSVFMLTDFFLVGHPFRLLHCYWPFLFTTCYIVFSVIYYEVGGTDRHDRPYVYPILDWRMPRRSILISACGLIFVLIVHCTTWLLFLLRRRLSTTFLKEDEEGQNDCGVPSPSQTSTFLKKDEERQNDCGAPSPSQTSIPMDSIIC